MRLRLAIIATLFALAWSLAAPSASRPEPASADACAAPLQVAQAPAPSQSMAQSGCCHYDGGVCGCEGGRARCCDGKKSASCRCGAPAAPTRQVRVALDPLLLVEDVAFADQTEVDPPARRLTWFRIGGDRLWFWLSVNCSDGCWSELAPDGSLNLELRWLFDPGSGPLLQGEPQRISLARGQRAIFVRRPTDRLRPGQWETEVRFDTERLCTRKGECWFPIEMRQ